MASREREEKGSQMEPKEATSEPNLNEVRDLHVYIYKNTKYKMLQSLQNYKFYKIWVMEFV